MLSGYAKCLSLDKRTSPHFLFLYNPVVGGEADTNILNFMKARKFLFAALIATLGMVACDVPDPQQPTDEPKTFTVKLGVKGEISVSQNPLTRFTPDNRDLYGIQVYHKPASESTYVPYAYGLFDNIDDVKLEVTENYNYNFEVMLVDDGKDKIFHDSILVDNVPYIGYDRPFYGYNQYSGASTSSLTKVTNEFTYAEDKYFKGKGTTNKGFSSVYYKTTATNSNYPLGIDSYYGELDDYTPTEEGATIDIYLKHMIYGLKVQVGDFFTEGSIKVSYYYDNSYYHNFTLTPDNKTAENIYAYEYVASWYGQTDITKATTTGYIDFVWTKADGTTVNWQKSSVNCTRLKQTVVNLDYYEDSTIGSNTIAIHYDDTEMEKDYKSYIIGDTQDEYDW